MWIGPAIKHAQVPRYSPTFYETISKQKEHRAKRESRTFQFCKIKILTEYSSYRRLKYYRADIKLNLLV